MEEITAYRRATDCFRESDKVRAAHLLYEDFRQERTDIPKLIFYIFMQENYMGLIGEDPDNRCTGYALEFIPKPQ